MASTVVVFDFDLTILDVDCDLWVVDQFGATDLFNSLLPTMSWNSIMDAILKELHLQGRTTEEIVECLKSAPLDSHTKSAIQTAHALGCDLKVVSDANTFFIETILKHHGIHECFTEITANPSSVDKEGRITILPYHDFSHGCSLCPTNMCKGLIIKRIRELAFAEGKKRFIYVGDGKGDYCPCLKLCEGDCVMPRKNFPLWDFITGNNDSIKADLHEWSNGAEQERILLQLINRPSAVNCRSSDLMSSADCQQIETPSPALASSITTLA